MGDCIFCGKPAGWFKTAHEECRQADSERIQAEVAENSRLQALQQAFAADLKQKIKAGQLVAVDAAISDEVAEGRLSFENRKNILVRIWAGLLEEFLEDGALTDDEESLLTRTKDRFQLSEADLNRKGAYGRFVKAAILSAVLKGETPNVALADGYGANLQQSETPVWSFSGVEYLEDRIRRQMVGGSQGVSLRVMKGVYYRVGAFKGEPVSTTQRVHVDTGKLLLTTKHLYFIGPAKSTRIPYSKVVSFEPYSNGFGLMRDAASAKPQLFLVDDPWFAYNLVTNLASRGG